MMMIMMMIMMTRRNILTINKASVRVDILEKVV